MKQFIPTTVLLLSICTSSFSQEHFVPKRPSNVSEGDFRTGEMILKNSYQQIAEDNYKIVASDYWNFAVAYQKMGQPKEMIYDFLLKAKFTDKKSFCEIVYYYHKKRDGIDSTSFFQLLKEDYRALVADCPETVAAESFDLEAYIKKNNYDRQLIYKLNDLITQDQEWRKGKEDDLKMIETDKANILKAEEIITKHGYPGTDMVGSKFDYVIWIVIQHAALTYQEKYLPLIAKAVEEKQLGKTSLRMLLDRIYTKKTGSQIFGSQIGVPFSGDKTIDEVKSKYNL